MIYLDHNATTPLDKRVRQAMLDIGDEPLNPSSVHSLGRKGKSLIEKARMQLMNMLNINRGAYQIIFTSGGTEANNLMLNNFSNKQENDKEKILISAIEHASIFEQQISLDNVEIVNVDNAGIVQLNDLEEKLKTKNYNLVSVMLANNETGAIQPVKEIAEMVHHYGALMHCDATCAAGKIKIDMQELGADFLTISAHKFGGPKGAGALIYKANLVLEAQVYGGKQEQSLRAGTENIEAIVGLGKAAELVSIELADRNAHMRNLQQKLEKTLEENFKVNIIAKKAERLPNTTLISVEGIDNQAIIINLDLKGIAVSSGSACSSGKVGASHVMRAMGFDEQQAKSAIRISLGYNQKIDDIEEFIKICINHKIFQIKNEQESENG